MAKTADEAGAATHEVKKEKVRKQHNLTKTAYRFQSCCSQRAALLACAQDEDEDEDEEECVYCYYICRHCFAFGTEDPDCTKCGKKRCVLLYTEPNSSMALAKAKSKNDDEDEATATTADEANTQGTKICVDYEPCKKTEGCSRLCPIGQKHR